MTVVPIWYKWSVRSLRNRLNLGQWIDFMLSVMVCSLTKGRIRLTLQQSWTSNSVCSQQTSSDDGSSGHSHLTTNQGGYTYSDCYWKIPVCHQPFTIVGVLLTIFTSVHLLIFTPTDYDSLYFLRKPET